MRNPSRSIAAALFALLGVGPWAAHAQAIPAPVSTAPGVGFELPRLGGSLTYALNASELISNGFYNTSGVTATTNVSGDLAYVSKSTKNPFSAVYSGGVLAANTSQPTTVYQSLAFSQLFTARRWNFGLADSVSYLPQAPVTGLSGIPGVGDLGVDPVTVGPTSGIGILTQYGPRVSNTASASVSRLLTGRLSLQASPNYSIQRFIGDNASLGIDNTSYGGSAGLSYRFDSRNSLTGNYNYSRFDYTDIPYHFTTQGATIDYSRQWNRRLTTDLYAGPQIIFTSSPQQSATSAQIAAGASVSFAGRSTLYSLSYSRGANNGSGVTAGSFADNVLLSAHRHFGRSWDLSGDLGYSHFSSLPGYVLYTYSGQSVAASGQLGRALTRRLSLYGSYTVQHQSTTVFSTAGNAFSGTYQVVGFGLTYSPAPILLGR